MKERLKGSGASTHPCFTQFEIWMGSKDSPSQRTRRPVLRSWRRWIISTNLLAQPNFARKVQRVSLLTASKALVRSMKTAYRSLFCSMHFPWLSHGNDYVSGVAAWTESTLCLRQVFFSEIVCETVQDHMRQDSSSTRKK